jgi:hypothetical protein
MSEPYTTFERDGLEMHTNISDAVRIDSMRLLVRMARAVCDVLKTEAEQLNVPAEWIDSPRTQDAIVYRLSYFNEETVDRMQQVAKVLNDCGTLVASAIQARRDCIVAQEDHSLLPRVSEMHMLNVTPEINKGVALPGGTRRHTATAPISLAMVDRNTPAPPNFERKRTYNTSASASSAGATRGATTATTRGRGRPRSKSASAVGGDAT